MTPPSRKPCSGKQPLFGMSGDRHTPLIVVCSFSMRAKDLIEQYDFSSNIIACMAW